MPVAGGDGDLLGGLQNDALPLCGGRDRRLSGGVAMHPHRTPPMVRGENARPCGTLPKPVPRPEGLKIIITNRPPKSS